MDKIVDFFTILIFRNVCFPKQSSGLFGESEELFISCIQRLVIGHVSFTLWGTSRHKVREMAYSIFIFIFFRLRRKMWAIYQGLQNKETKLQQGVNWKVQVVFYE